MDSNIKVAIRCRPMSNRETARNCKCIITMPTHSTVHVDGVDEASEARDFTFDHCYYMDSVQEHVYKDLGQPLLMQALDGFNGTIFAYGQTGSGKSFSMMGSDENPGIVPQLNNNIWKSLADLTAKDPNAKYMITVSFLEIYNEIIKDLLNPSEKQLKIRESPKMGIYVEGLCELIVRDGADLLRLIDQGNAVRRVAATNMNDQSSRSHSCFTIKVEKKVTTELEGGITKENLVKAKLNLVDLAGSERAEKTGATGSVLKEGANINMSLMALGKVINALSEGGGKSKFIPYRDSKLTRLLQESLGGNSLTVMLAAISPADYNYDETVSTLKYANRAKSIANAVSRNEDSNEKLIRGLKEEIELLKQQLVAGGGAEANPEMDERLREMELRQQSAWEEKEALQKQLQLERQANLNIVMSNMMETVKDQKVQQMKAIKRLTNEKAIAAKKFKDLKDENGTLKAQLDSSMSKYKEKQSKYDELVSSGADPDVLNKVASEMAVILVDIERDRAAWVLTKDNAKNLKNRMAKIEEELTEQKGLLVTTAGILDQNEKIRNQIQQEEREKAKEMIESELAKAREKFEVERAAVRGKIEGEIAIEMDDLRSQISALRKQLAGEQLTVHELKTENSKLVAKIETLEDKLTDAEVNQEYTDSELNRLSSELDVLEDLKTEMQERTRELALVKESKQLEKEKYEQLLGKIQAERQFEANATKSLMETEKYSMFRVLMDGFMEERTVMQRKISSLQERYSHAAKDVLYMSKQNQELLVQLHQAIQWDPITTFPSGLAGTSKAKSAASLSSLPALSPRSNHNHANGSVNGVVNGFANGAANGSAVAGSSPTSSPSTASSSLAPIRPKKWSTFLPSVTETAPTAAELETFSSKGSDNGQVDSNNPFGMKPRPLMQRKAQDGSNRAVSFAPAGAKT